MEAGLLPNWLQGPPAAIVCSQAFFLPVAGGDKKLRSTTRNRVSRGLPISSHRTRAIRFCGILRSSAGSTPRASERRPTTLRLA
jgi:hypothetical protein